MIDIMLQSSSVRDVPSKRCSASFAQAWQGGGPSTAAAVGEQQVTEMKRAARFDQIVARAGLIPAKLGKLASAQDGFGSTTFLRLDHVWPRFG